VALIRPIEAIPGVQCLTGENLEFVWAEFSTLSQAVSVDKTINAQNANGRF
jgi:hypothetical protein